MENFGGIKLCLGSTKKTEDKYHKDQYFKRGIILFTKSNKHLTPASENGVYTEHERRIC